MENFKKGDRVEISLYSNEGETYFSILDAVLDNTQVIILMPIVQWYFVKLSPEHEYYLSFVSTIDFSLLRFRANIVSYSKKGDLYFILLKLKGEGERIERRNHYRFPYQSPFVFYKIGETEGIGVDLNIYYDAMLMDISGGGIRFMSNEELEKNSRINCLITLGSEQLNSDGSVMNKKNTPKESYRFEYRVKFDGDAMVQDRIVQFIFEQQRKTNKRLPSS